MERSRIIPARAGFTITPAGQRSMRRDHPRSRGVYKHGVMPILALEGSSPLARGLLSCQVPKWAPTGIIPARAGF
ncbi:hypothetical protein HMPREF1979_03283, partial [Actinomyces johnsonii F0542]